MSLHCDLLLLLVLPPHLLHRVNDEEANKSTPVCSFGAVASISPCPSIAISAKIDFLKSPRAR